MNNGGSGGVAGLPQSPMFGGPPAMYGSFMDHYMTHGAPGTPDIYGSPAGMPYGRWGGGATSAGPAWLERRSLDAQRDGSGTSTPPSPATNVSC